MDRPITVPITRITYFVCYSLIVGMVSMVAASLEQPIKTYHGDAVLRVTVPDAKGWNTVHDIITTGRYKEHVDIWRAPSMNSLTSDLHVKNSSLQHLMQEFTYRRINHSIAIPDVQRLIDQSFPPHRLRRETRHHNSIVGTYASFEQILSWLDNLQRKHSPYVSLEDIGSTHEGRPMRVIKIGIPDKSVKKPAIWIDAGFHAREWVTHSTAVYIIHTLVQGLHDESSDAYWLLQYLDFYILPVANPDGYVYTFTTERLWRKNRRPITENCTGVDINRNFRFQWGQGHTSDNPCSIMYRGEKPETEQETRHVTQFLLPRAHHVLAYVTLHSYMQHFYTRYDYAPGQYPTDHQTLLSLAERAADAMSAENGSLYHVGTAADILYSYGGGSADWAKAIANIKYSYLIELRDGGTHGFLLPPSQITPTGQETWAGVHTIARELITRYIKPETSEDTSAEVLTTKSTAENEVDELGDLRVNQNIDIDVKVVASPTSNSDKTRQYQNGKNSVSNIVLPDAMFVSKSSKGSKERCACCSVTLLLFSTCLLLL